MGQMAKGAKQSPPSPLTIEMERFVIVTAVIASITAIAFLIVGLCISSADFKTLFILIIGKYSGLPMNQGNIVSRQPRSSSHDLFGTVLALP